MTWVNRPGSLWSLRLLACCACLLAMPAYAVVLHFENLGDAYLDIVVSFATPVSAAEGDVVFNPTVTASAIAYDANGELVDHEYFASGSEDWIAGHFSFASAEGIVTILLRTDIPEAQIGLDNLAFTPVPEPSSRLALLGGVVLLAIARSRPGLRLPALSSRKSDV